VHGVANLWNRPPEGKFYDTVCASAPPLPAFPFLSFASQAAWRGRMALPGKADGWAIMTRFIRTACAEVKSDFSFAQNHPVPHPKTPVKWSEEPEFIGNADAFRFCFSKLRRFERTGGSGGREESSHHEKDVQSVTTPLRERPLDGKRDNERGADGGEKGWTEVRRCEMGKKQFSNDWKNFFQSLEKPGMAGGASRL
jgi:hypothetical protein